MTRSGYRIRVVPSSWWPKGRSLEHDGLFYSCSVDFEEADGLLALYDPTEELLRFKGPKLWYTYEPSWHAHYHQHPVGKRLVKTLRPSEWAYFANRDPAYRVPHITFGIDLTKTTRCENPRNAAVAAVNNCGGQFWFLKPHIWQRNWLILEPRVELFGSRSWWKTFRHFPAVWRRGAPRNYRGESNLTHMQDAFREFLSQYKVCVCLENSCEPHYFTEKFVNAVRAGCVPIYHAHPTVAERFLKGAKWVDPGDVGFSAKRTLDCALGADLESFQTANDAWLDSGVLDPTGYQGYFSQLHAILKGKLTSEPAQPLPAETIRSLDAQQA